MSDPVTVSARYLTVGDVVYPGPADAAPRAVTTVGDEGGMVAVTFAQFGIPLLYDPDAQLVVATKPVPSAPAPPADPREEVIAAARAVRDAWYGDHPAGVDTTSVMGLTIGTLDARLARLDALVADRVDTPEQVTTSCPAGVACTGRDGKPSPHACPVCKHCAEHGAGGCAARTDDGRCGCTGGGAS